LAVTDAFPFNVNVQLFRLVPPLEQAPDQMTSRPPASLNLIEEPTANDADPVLPTTTLSPLGLEVMCSPLRPLAVTVTVAVWDGGGGDELSGFTVNCADCVTPPPVTEIVTTVVVVTCDVKILKPPAIVPLGTITLLFTLAIVG